MQGIIQNVHSSGLVSSYRNQHSTEHILSFMLNARHGLLVLACCVVALGVFISACSEDTSTPPPTSTTTSSVSQATTSPAPTAVPTRAVPTLTAAPTPARARLPTSTAVAKTPEPESAPVPVPAATPTASIRTPQLTSATADTERRGGVINLVNRQVIEHQDVHRDVSETLAAWGPGIAYSRLMRFESGADVELPSLSVMCEFCREWRMPDATTFEFNLREDVMWQNLQPVNGRSLVAGDIVFSYERQRGDGMPNGALLHSVDTVEATGDDSLRVRLLAPDADFLMTLANGHTKIVAREAVDLNGDLLEGPTVGSGPWILEETDSDLAFSFRRNENYFDEDAPLLDRIRIHTIVDEDTAYAAFRVNNLDVHRVRPVQWNEFSRQKPDASMLAFKETGRGLEVGFKTTEPPLDDLKVRQAAMLGMRPDRAIEEIWQGATYLTQGVPLARADWQLDDDELATYFDDHVAARVLLAEAVESLPVPVVIHVGDFGTEYRAHAENIAGAMQSVGFDPRLEVVDRRQFGERVWLGGHYQIFVGPTAPAASPNAYMLTVLSSDGAWNTTGHRDEALDTLILAQAGEYDPAKRRQLVVEVQRHALKNAYRFMPGASVSLWAWWPHVQGFEPNFAGAEYSHWERVWLKD